MSKIISFGPFDAEVVFSPRRTVSLTVGRDRKVTVRAPLGIKENVLREFVFAHSDWITKKISETDSKRNVFGPFSDETVDELKRKAREYIVPRVGYWTEKTGLFPAGIRITSAKTRFGSCSRKDSVCFSCYLMNCTTEEIDYVIVHELAHIRHKNHGTEFYSLIESVFPDYRRVRQSLMRTVR
ncbi:MAG: DUF45 domain-containing protein [Clostridia bacterium]|nr:DUF45 domain-containing protein [Clostridia bacterium]